MINALIVIHYLETVKKWSMFINTWIVVIISRGTHYRLCCYTKIIHFGSVFIEQRSHNDHEKWKNCVFKMLVFWSRSLRYRGVWGKGGLQTWSCCLRWFIPDLTWFQYSHIHLKMLNTLEDQQNWQICPRYVICHDRLFYNPYLVATLILIFLLKTFPMFSVSPTLSLWPSHNIFDRPRCALF